MRKIYLLTIALLCIVVQGWASSFPVVSPATDIRATWYQIKFMTGGNVLMDNGTGAFMTTTVDNPSQFNQLWCLLDAGESNYYIVSKDGNYVSWGNNRFQTTNEVGGAVKLKVIQSSAYADYFEIQRNDASNNMNQFGGSSVGVQLGEWTPGDINNPLTFVEADALFSNGSNEYWYNIKFKKSNLQIQDNGIGEKATIQNIDMSSDAQQWKLVGNQNQFQLISKNGCYANMQEADGTFKMFSKSAEDTNGFALKQNGDGFEIKWNGANDNRAYFNPWQGASACRPPRRPWPVL